MTASHKKHEYRIEQIKIGKTTLEMQNALGRLNTLGASGWELCFVWPDHNNVLLKRVVGE